MKPGNTALGKTVTLCKSIGIVVGKYLLRNRDFYLLAIGLWASGLDSNVLFFCYLPQLLHYTPSASEVRSLASLSRLKLDLRTQLGESCTANWLRSQV